MIADELGVTKAAVYHQFHTKDEIVLAVLDAEVVRLVKAVEQAEAADALGSSLEARETLLEMVVDMAIGGRHMAHLLQSDPVIVGLLADHQPWQDLMVRVYGLLAVEEGEDGQVQAAMLSAAMGAAVSHPLVAHLDDETLRAQLLRLGRRLADLPT
jgi:AcrR family transcriptional regulator